MASQAVTPLLVVCLLVASVVAGPTSRQQKVHLDRHSLAAAEGFAGTAFIFGGAVASLGQFPWQAGLQMDGSWVCSAAIISEDWVLTSAHCTDGFKAYVVTVGSLDRKGGGDSGKSLETTETYYHPQFNAEYADNDIGLLHLQTKLVFSPNVKAVSLPSYSWAWRSLVGEQALTAGWGFQSDDDIDYSSSLRFATLPIIADAECYKRYGNQMLPNKICCSTESSGSICGGDSGAPLIVTDKEKSVIVGVAAFGSPDGCTLRQPVAFTKVSSFLDFIQTTTGIEIEF